MQRFTESFPRLAKLAAAGPDAKRRSPTGRRVDFSIRLTSAVAVPFAALYLWGGMWPMALVLGGALVTATFLWLLLRGGSSPARVGEAWLTLLFAVVCALGFFAGGSDMVALSWFFVLPVGATAILGHRVAVRWVILSTLGLLGFIAYATFGPGLESWVPQRLQPVLSVAAPLSAAGTIGVLVVTLVRSHIRALDQVNDSHEKLHTERKRLEVLASYDALTVIPNRFACERVLSERLASSPVTLLFIDVDRFKDVNDAYGHSMGDELLRRISRRLQRVARSHLRSRAAAECKPFVARWGGDEFAVVLTGARTETAESLANAVVQALAFPVDIDDHRLHLGGSVGIAFALPETPTHELVRNADIALYRVKGRGGHGFEVFESTSLDHVQRRVLLGNALREALVRGELRLQMQPLYDRDRSLVGAEALIRWRSSTLGEVSPAEFIPVAEQSGQMPAIGAFVLEQACVAASSWPAHLRVSVNVSVTQLNQDDMVAVVQRALERSALPAHRLELEITESVLADDRRIIRTLEHISALGVGLALDDFGTGYSSLATLRELPVDRVKIDRSFVRAIHERDDDVAVVRAIVGMAHALDLLVLAEGIEAREQLDLLRDLGCDEMQGYFLGRPVELSRMARLAKGSSSAIEAVKKTGAAILPFPLQKA